MPLALPKYTLADLERFPEDGNRYELLAGMLLVTPGAENLHQTVLSRLFGEILNYLKPVGLAYAVSPGVVRSGNDTQLEPDLLVLPSRFAAAPWKFVTDQWLAVEVSGPDSRVYDRDYKQAAYLALGVREAWRVDLQERRIHCLRPGGKTAQSFADQIRWHPPEMPAALELSIPSLFAW